MIRSSELESVGMDPGAFSRTWEVIRSGVSAGVAPGMVAGVWLASDPGRFLVLAHGHEPETVFDLASVTKVMATASLTAALVDRRWIDWDTSLRAVLPEARGDGVTFRHLLSHTAGYVAWIPLWERMRERANGTDLHAIAVTERQRWMRELVLGIAPDVAPGERAVYSDISFLLLGFALEEITRMPLDRAVRELLWGPMRVDGAFYSRVDRSVEKGRLENVAPTENCSWRGGVIQGQVHDDNCWSMGGYAGHAGAFGSARDVLQFARQCMGGFFSPETLRVMWTRVNRPAGCERTPGWDTPSGAEPSSGRYFGAGSVGHLGFTGTSLWIDPSAGIAVTLLTNRVHPSRENTLIRAFRPRFHDAIREDLRQRGAGTKC